MAFTLNKVMLIGNLGKDAETKTVNNTSITSFQVATTNSYKKNDEWINDTTWHNVVLFNGSDYLKKNLKKGKKFYIEGRLSRREYTDKDKIKRYAVEVISEQIILLDDSQTN